MTTSTDTSIDSLKERALDRIYFTKAVHVPKGWGKEVQIANNLGKPLFPQGYSGKLLVYTKDMAVSSMHSHGIKHETFYVLSGEFLFRWLSPEDAQLHFRNLAAGDVVVIPPLNQHQVICVKEGTIIEFASADYSWDNYRVYKGDSQTKNGQ